MPGKFEIRGLDRVLRNLKTLREAAHDETEETVGTAGERIAERARELAPVRTGELRGSIGAEPTSERSGVITSTMRATADHAALVHEEHPTHRKFLQRAALETGSELPKELRDHLRARATKELS